MGRKIAIATINRVKAKAVKEAFEEFLDEKDSVTVKCYQVNSNVPEQPFGNDVMCGAENRVKELKKLNIKADYYVGVEAGIIELAGKFFNIQAVCIESNGKWSYGLSQGLPISGEYIEEIKNKTLANVMREIFEGPEDVSILTNGLEDRGTHIKEGTIMALTKQFSNIW